MAFVHASYSTSCDLELVERLLPARQLVLLEQRGDALHVVGIARQFSLNLGARGIDHARLGHLLHHALLQDFSQRLVSRFQPGIFADADHRRRPPFRRRLLIQQNPQPAEDGLAGVQKINFVGAREIQLPELQLDPADHDLEVLRHFLLLLLPHARS